MSNFFVSTEIYDYRLDLCRSCEHYFRPTGTCLKCGCFMRIKASIGSLGCPVEKWSKTSEKRVKNDIPEHILKEVRDVWTGIANGKAKDIETKKRAIELHNTIYGTGYKTTTNCGSCLHDVRQGIKKIIDNDKTQ